MTKNRIKRASFKIQNTKKARVFTKFCTKKCAKVRAFVTLLHAFCITHLNTCAFGVNQNPPNCPGSNIHPKK